MTTNGPEYQLSGIWVKRIETGNKQLQIGSLNVSSATTQPILDLSNPVVEIGYQAARVTTKHLRLYKLNDAQHGWIKHCIQLSAAILRVPKETLMSHYTGHQIDMMDWMLHAKTATYQYVCNNKAIPDTLQPVFDYLIAYADLHIKWYSHAISDESFHEQMAIARTTLNDMVVDTERLTA